MATMKRILSAFIVLFVLATSSLAATEALQIDALWSGLMNSTNGKAYSGAIIATFAADGSTPKAVWENKEKTQPSALGKAQFTLDSSGAAEVFGDGVYVIKVYAPTDTLLSSPLRTLDGLTYINNELLVDEAFDVDHNADYTHIVYESIADLRASTLTPFDGQVATLTGYYASTENQDWRFKWDASSTATDDLGMYIKVASITTGRWVRLVLNGELSDRMFGSVANATNSDSVAIQACHDAALLAGYGVMFDKGERGIGAEIDWSVDVPVRSMSGAKFRGVDSVVNGINLSDGNFRGENSFPDLTLFPGYAIKFKGTNVATVFISTISFCGDAIVLETVNSTHQNMLDSNYKFQQITGCDRAIVLSADNILNAMQGNLIEGNFIAECEQSVVFEDNGLPTSPGWDSNKFHFQAIDPTDVYADAVMLYNPNVNYAIARVMFNVDTWCGGLATTAKYIDGKFNFLQANLGLSQFVGDGMIDIQGQDNNVRLNRYASKINLIPVQCSATSNNKSGFNGGVPLYRNREKLQITLDTLINVDATQLWYIYHSLADNWSNNFRITQSDVGSTHGILFDHISDNQLANDDEIVIQIRNVAGALLPVGTEIDFIFEVGF